MDPYCYPVEESSHDKERIVEYLSFIINPEGAYGYDTPDDTNDTSDDKYKPILMYEIPPWAPLFEQTTNEQWA